MSNWLGLQGTETGEDKWEWVRSETSSLSDLKYTQLSQEFVKIKQEFHQVKQELEITKQQLAELQQRVTILQPASGSGNYAVFSNTESCHSIVYFIMI